MARAALAPEEHKQIVTRVRDGRMAAKAPRGVLFGRKPLLMSQHQQAEGRRRPDNGPPGQSLGTSTAIASSLRGCARPK